MDCKDNVLYSGDLYKDEDLFMLGRGISPVLSPHQPAVSNVDRTSCNNVIKPLG
jgi:hypothetical protein